MQGSTLYKVPKRGAPCTSAFGCPRSHAIFQGRRKVNHSVLPCTSPQGRPDGRANGLSCPFVLTCTSFSIPSTNLLGVNLHSSAAHRVKHMDVLHAKSRSARRGDGEFRSKTKNPKSSPDLIVGGGIYKGITALLVC